MDSSRPFFDSSVSHGNMLFLGSTNPMYGGPSTTMISKEDSVAKKRPFLMLQDELYYDEEYYDEQLPEKKRRLTPEQVVLLEKSFEEENKLEPERKSELAKKVGLQPRQVAVWFQNRRARSKTKQLERDFDVLKASYDTLLSDYYSILKEKNKLKSAVHSLAEKLQDKDKNIGRCLPTATQVSVAVDDPTNSTEHQLTKAEDRLSSGSDGASVIVNGENPQVVDSGDSYFDCLPPSPPCIAAVQSEDDDISDDGRSYFSGMFTMALDHGYSDGHEGGDHGHQDLGWWVWS